MQRKLWGPFVAACSLLATFAFAAGSAEAATSVATTYPAIDVAAESAYVTGTISTSGVAAFYEFQYGTTADYGQATKTAGIPAGKDVVFVYDLLTGLKPNTTYHYRVAAAAEQLGPYGYGYGYYGTFGAGSDVTFKTKGAGSITRSKFSFKKGRAVFNLKCSSTIGCKGKYSASVKTKVKKKTKTYTCISGTFSLGAGITGKYSPKIGKSCAALIKKAKHSKLGGVSFTVTSSTYQSKLTAKITL